MFADYAVVWRAAEKVVYSRALRTGSRAGTRIERELDPDAVRRLKQSSGTDLAVGGAEIAGHALGAGLVDQCQLFLCPGRRAPSNRPVPDTGRSAIGQERPRPLRTPWR